MRTREQVWAGGYQAICAPKMADRPGCEHHDHLPGEPMEQEGGPVRQVLRQPIPFSRVQQLVRDLLGTDDLTDIRGVHVHHQAVEVELYARGHAGARYLTSYDQDVPEPVAVDRIHIPVVPDALLVEVVHGCPPDGSGVTPCCGRTPFELPHGDRMAATDAPDITCRGRS